MKNTKLLLRIVQSVLLIAIFAPAITWLRFLPNHTRIMLIVALIGAAWLTALVCIPLAMYSNSKFKDHDSKLAMWLGVGVIILPIAVWAVFMIVLGIGLSSNPL